MFIVDYGIDQFDPVYVDAAMSGGLLVSRANPFVYTIVSVA